MQSLGILRYCPQNTFQIMNSFAPMLVEFSGLPATGKSTTINLLRETLSKRGHASIFIPAASSVSPLAHLKHDWIFDVWALCRTIKQTIEQIENQDATIVVFERAIVDTLCWIEWFKDLGNIEPESANILEQFALLPRWAERFSLTVVLQAGYQTALRRSGNSNWIVNEVNYRSLGSAYNRKIETLSDSRPNMNIFLLDTDQLSPQNIHDLVLTRLEALGLDR